jgi:hypothetical protein
VGGIISVIAQSYIELAVGSEVYVAAIMIAGVCAIGRREDSSGIGANAVVFFKAYYPVLKRGTGAGIEDVDVTIAVEIGVNRYAKQALLS